ncbi:MAG TPA: type II toxin-antitoxin system death-on-curing family toxin [Polyangiaceae bacterium]|nr:type II toxin-antitoxin system death-on-curing family toxin [Polyangiaceae bacterium]
MTDFAAPLFLKAEEVLTLHSDQLRLFGGSDGLRDPAALDSAVATPAATFAGDFLHPDLFHMAAAYAFHISQNQPFVDGNKRTALNAALVFLDINGWLVSDPGSLLYDAMIAIAERRLDKAGLAALLQKLAVPGPEST